MNPKAIIILLAVLVLAIGALVMTREREETPHSGEPAVIGPAEQQRLFEASAFEPGIDALSIQPRMNDPHRLALSREQGQWTIQHPHTFPADHRRIDELLQTLQGLQGERLEGSVPTGDFVLPGISFYSGLQHFPYDIRLGQRLGSGKAVVYVSHADNIYVAYRTDDALHDLFESNPFGDYYARKIDLPLLSDVALIGLEVEGRASKLTQREGSWLIGDDDNAERALAQGIPEQPGIDGLFSLLSMIELGSLQDHTASEEAYGLTNPIARIKLFLSSTIDDDIIEIKVGVAADPQDQNRYVSINDGQHANPPVFTVASQHALLLGQDATAFRDPRVITTYPTLIDSILLGNQESDGFKTSGLIRLDHMTFVKKNPEAPDQLDQKQVAMMLDLLQRARASDYLPVSSLTTETMTSVIIKPKLQGETETFAILADPASTEAEPTVLIQREREPVALRVPRDAVAGLLEPMSLVASEKD